jgi:CHAD domain-containing protein
MAYHFLVDSTVDVNGHRLLNEQLDRAIIQLSDRFGDNPEQAVHRARKCLKKARSVLRLGRYGIGQAAYKRENAALRAIGQALAPARDGAVYQTTLRTLLETYSLSLEAPAFAALDAYLGDRYRRELQALSDRNPGITPIVTDLKDAQARLGHIPFKKTGWAALAQGLRRIYRQGKDRFRVAYQDPSDVAFHAWRKRVKDLWYDICLLESLWPAVMEVTGNEAHRLSEILGDDHDIAALRHFLLLINQLEAGSAIPMQALMPLMDHRQAKLRRQAQGLGQKLYSETPKAFVKRLDGYWQVEAIASTCQ